MEYFLADLLAALGSQGISCTALAHAEGRSWRGSRPADDAALPVYRAPTFGRLLYAPVSPSFPLWLNRVIREQRPDLLHLHLPNTSAFAALALPAARRLPWVIHWHSDVVASTIDPRLRLAYQLYRPFEQRLLAGSRRIIATSPTYLRSSTALAPWLDRCAVVPLGLDPTRIPEPDHATLARAEAMWGKSALRILAIGRLTYYKGHEVLIRAAAELPEARVIIVGAGERREPLVSLVQTLGLGNRVELPGYQSEPMLNALLASCDLLCLPSIERTEAFGLVLLEAMRFGKPVVVSDIPGSGTGWVVHAAGHGLLTPPNESAPLAVALAMLQKDPKQRERLGDAGKAALREQFGIAKVAEAIAKIYSEVLA